MIMDHDSYVRQVKNLNETIRRNDADQEAREAASDRLAEVQQTYNRTNRRG
jgi:hypothetical protein